MLVAPTLVKSSWPELLFYPATQAVMKIALDRPDVAVEVLPPGTTIVPGFNPKRVRVFINDYGEVSQIPVIG